jgi:hypothetical protein
MIIFSKKIKELRCQHQYVIPILMVANMSNRKVPPIPGIEHNSDDYHSEAAFDFMRDGM